MSASSHFNTSFSSAAAGKDTGTSNHVGNSAAVGGGVSIGGDWSRRVNGATSNSTTRRPSLSTTLTHPINNSLPSSASNVYHPPHHYNRQAAVDKSSYGKDELLDIRRMQEAAGQLGSQLVDLLDTDFEGSGSANAGWGRGGDDPTNGVDLCWDKDGGLKPLALEPLTEADQELFAGNVNSPHKTLTNNQGAANNHGTPPSKRTNAPGTGITPGTSRPATRRREPSDAGIGGNPFATSTPPQITRRRTDLRDGDDGGSPSRERAFYGRWGSTAAAADDENKDKEEGSSSGGTIGRNAGLFRRGSSAATWGASAGGSALNSPMGTFGGGAFGGGPMGGFALQAGDKAKAKSNSVSAQPKAQQDVNERPEEESPPQSATENYDEERERPMTSDTDPFGLGGAEDHHSTHDDRNSPLPTPGLLDSQRMKNSPFGPGAGISISTNNPRIGSSLGTPTKQRELGFSSFASREGLGGMGNHGMTGLHQQLQNLTFNQQGQVPLRRSREGSIGNALAGDHEPLSPAETNPFTSPPPEKVDDEMNDHNESGGLGSVIAAMRRGEHQNVGAPGSDRSGRSSTAGLGSVGGGLAFGGLSGPGVWGSGQGAGTPSGIGSSGVGSSFFAGNGLGDLTPGAMGGNHLLSGGLGGVGGLGGSGHFGSASRASRLGLFSDNQQHQDDGPTVFEPADAFSGDSRFFSSRRGFGSINDSPMRERGDVNDLFGFPAHRSLNNLAGSAAIQENSVFRDREELGLQTPSHQPQQESPLGPGAQNPGALRPPPGTLPSLNQQHVMVMPDKIQWVYRDPSGVVQGPFNGLEMHDWYRAGFFTTELAVKRQEDIEFEPLGNLVRKIGNTREPFLVPLPGSSSGMSTNAAANWPGSWLNETPGVQPAVQTPGSVQPPFAGAFPTFGTTLTAEQQNALERRKQEEQYIMAKQREFLLQQQMIAKQVAATHQLHHTPSTHSLHSQPSFGSLNSPANFAPPIIPASASSIVGGQNAFEPGALLRQAGAAAGGVGNSDVSGQLGFQQQFQTQVPQQQPQDQGSLIQQQKFSEQQRQQQLQKTYQAQQTQHVEKQLQEAQEQVKHEEEPEEPEQEAEPIVEEEPVIETQSQPEPAPIPKANTPAPAPVVEQPAPKPSTPKPSTPAAKPTPQPAWGGVQAQPGPAPLVQPFPPPPARETSPSSSMARSPVEAPSAPSIAPWAKEAENHHKTPSLKEIQELEAKQAAAREAAEEKARREMLAQQLSSQPPPPAPGLPSTATWATTSPSTTPGGSSAWNKPLAKASTVSSGQKTLRQIQKEEEARKAKAAAQAASQALLNTPSPVSSSNGKRYADLASKAANSSASATAGSSAWTTVGPSGKVKGAPVTPTTPAAVPTGPAQTIRPTTSSIGSFTATPTIKRPSPPVTAKPPTSSAQEEFLKWCRGSMVGLGAGVSAESVIENLSNFPPDIEIIADTIYAVSTVMDGRRWAEEYIKRRNAASSGVVIEAGTAARSSGGWNEVAKSRPTTAAPAPLPETSSSFKVVAGKGKKSGRR
ncbi:hypothetical protein FPQ18DRAFT_358634 [Pyronema domesticum]|nr:hypothetical protein FPQ18DRAFT_358634 [Pyronema domesticum]